MEKKELLYSGKVKDLYATDNPTLLLAKFRDDTTAFDGEKHELLSEKGKVNNAISAHIMQILSESGIPTHQVEVLTPTESLVKRLRMIPVECVIRNVAAGSLCRRLGVEQNKKLDPPLFELFLKNDELHDPLINRNHAISFGWASEVELDKMEEYTRKINQVLKDVLGDAGMVLVDSKYEFGVDVDGNLCLGDEISPDSCRIWDDNTLEPLDKDRFRKDMGGVMDAYKEIAARLGVAV